MNGLALCAGVGGLERALSLLLEGYRTVCYVEREVTVVSAIVKQMEKGYLAPAPIWDDVTTFDGRMWREKVDIVTAGYPCQPFSKIGNQGGEQDSRYIWPDIYRIINETGPKVVVIENVANHLRNGFDRTVRDLVKSGYRVASGLFEAIEAGAPFKRRRLFAVAFGKGVERLVAGETISFAGPWRWRGKEDLCRIFDAPFERGDRWPEPLVRGMDDGLACRADRLRMCGNGVNPYQAALAILALAAKLEGVEGNGS